MNENTKKTGNKNKKEKKKKPLFDLETEVGRLKLEIAEELGLREKIETDPSHPEHLLTVRGFGYQWKEVDE